MSGGELVAVIGSALTLVGLVVTGLFTRASAKAAQKSSPYAALADRVVRLETKVAEQDEVVARLKQADQRKGLEIIHLRGEVRVLGEHAVEVHEWIEDGMPPPAPKMPESVARVVQRLCQDLERQHVAEPGATD